MTDISRAMAHEIADLWEVKAGTEKHATPGRRETLRECADMLRMLAELNEGIGPHRLAINELVTKRPPEEIRDAQGQPLQVDQMQRREKAIADAEAAIAGAEAEMAKNPAARRILGPFVALARWMARGLS